VSRKILTYIWLDGYETPNLRSKRRYVVANYHIPEGQNVPNIEDIDEWGFDGSSTGQAEGNFSDCVLSPVRIYLDPTGQGDYLVLCQVMNPDGTPHESNTRHRLDQLSTTYSEHEMWFGIEQEYLFVDPNSNRPYGWPEIGFPNPQGRYYCGVGGDVTRLRSLVDSHAWNLHWMGIPIEGTNAEVMLSQWEYQIGPDEPLKMADDLWIARYVLEVMAENDEVGVSLAPKPVHGDWNGSGAHINFSTKYMRESSDQYYITDVLVALKNKHEEHIEEYGVGNEDRLTGAHETQHIDTFSYGNSDRGASIRIPPRTAQTGRGYLEDRRPAANMDPYRALACLVETVCSVSSYAPDITLPEVSQ
jgi:glutamine synthetase